MDATYQVPNLMEFDELKLRKQVLVEWFKAQPTRYNIRVLFIFKGKAKMAQH